MSLTIAQTSALKAVHAYKMVVSPWLQPACRFTPTCSEYAVRAMEAHGLWRGLWLAFRRLCKCHPFHPGGYDPVR